MDYAGAATGKAERQDRVRDTATRLADVIRAADVQAIIDEINRIATETDSIDIFNFRGYNSLIHTAAETGNWEILRLLLDRVDAQLIATEDDWGNTPLHIVCKANAIELARMLIDRAGILHARQVVGMKNKYGNTTLHEAILNGGLEMVELLLSVDPSLVYLKNEDQKSPLYLALDNNDERVCNFVFTSQLEPSQIQGLPPVHGAVLREKYDLLDMILTRNKELFAMTDSKGSNIFHFAAHMNRTAVFDRFFGQETLYLAQKQDKNGDLPIHIASKMGNVELMRSLDRASYFPNGRRQNALHVAAKYGQASVVRHILGHMRLRTLINERDQDGNTPLHLAAMHSQPAAMIPLVLDEHTKPFLLNNQQSTALGIARDRIGREYTLRKQLAVMVLASTCGKSPAGNEAIPLIDEDKEKPNMDHVKNLIGNRSVVATLVATVTFAAGFAVPGGFNSSDKAFKSDQGMATLLENRMFQAFAICNTLAMFCSMTAVVTLLWAQQNDVHTAMVAYRHSILPLRIALPAMSAAFLTGVTLTVGELPWLADTIFYLGLVFLLIISVAKLLLDPPLIWSRRRPIRIVVSWLVLVYIYLWEVETDLLDDKGRGQNGGL